MMHTEWIDDRRLAALEDRTYRTVDDGLWDILLGLFLLAFPIGDVSQFPFLPSVVGVLAVASWKHLRRAISYPRVGYVRLHETRMSRLRWAQCIVAAAFGVTILAVLALQALGRSGVWQVPGEWRPLVTSAMLALPMGAAAHTFGIRRLYLYAVIVAIAVAFGDPLSALWIVGGALMACGVYVLARFLQRYPLTPNEGAAG